MDAFDSQRVTLYGPKFEDEMEDKIIARGRMRVGVRYRCRSTLQVCHVPTSSSQFMMSNTQIRLQNVSLESLFCAYMHGSPVVYPVHSRPTCAMFKASIFRWPPLPFVVLSLGALHHVRGYCVASGMSLDSLHAPAHLPWTFVLSV